MRPDATRMYDFNDNVQIAVTYELSPDFFMIRRQVYTLLDYMGDIGGLAGALHGLFVVTIIVFQYKATISYVSNHTYLAENEEEKRNKTPEK